MRIRPIPRIQAHSLPNQLVTIYLVKMLLKGEVLGFTDVKHTNNLHRRNHGDLTCERLGSVSCRTVKLGPQDILSDINYECDITHSRTNNSRKHLQPWTQVFYYILGYFLLSTLFFIHFNTYFLHFHT